MHTLQHPLVCLHACVLACPACAYPCPRILCTALLNPPSEQCHATGGLGPVRWGLLGEKSDAGLLGRQLIFFAPECNNAANIFKPLLHKWPDAVTSHLCYSLGFRQDGTRLGVLRNHRCADAVDSPVQPAQARQASPTRRKMSLAQCGLCHLFSKIAACGCRTRALESTLQRVCQLGAWAALDRLIRPT